MIEYVLKCVVKDNVKVESWSIPVLTLEDVEEIKARVIASSLFEPKFELLVRGVCYD